MDRLLGGSVFVSPLAQFSMSPDTAHPPPCATPRGDGGGTDRCSHKVGAMNSEQLQGLAVLALAMVPVALLWWVWIRMLD